MRVRRGRETGSDPESVVASLFGIESDRNSGKSLRKSWVTSYLLPLGSVLIAALTFLTQNLQLPKWAIVAAVLYLVVVTGVSLYSPVIWLVALTMGKVRIIRLASRSLPRLAEMAQRLRQLITRGNSDTVLYVIQEAAQWEELRNQLTPATDPEHVETLRSWLSSMEERIGSSRRNTFPSFCQEFSQLVFQYHRFCCQRQRILQEAITAGRLQEPRLRYLKQQWNVQREGHIAFIREWAGLAKRINEASRQKLCLDYYEPLGTLE